MLSWPSETPYDLRFRLFGVPTRVHPMFWLATALLGGMGTSRFEYVLLWIGCVFVSIVVHEFGHALTARALGSPAEVVLYWMGGLCRSEVDGRHHPFQRFLQIFMGPGAGFLFCGLMFAAAFIAYRITPLEVLALMPVNLPSSLELAPDKAMDLVMKLRRAGPWVARALGLLAYINILWGLLNLLPIWPLDGGQITGVVLGVFAPSRGRNWTHAIGLVTAGVLAFLSYQYTQDLFLTMFFGLFALSNYQILQMMHQQSRYGAFEDEGEWWRR